MSGGERGSDPVADRLSPVDHELLAHLLAHRVLTTPQLITLVDRPERSVDHRLSRLRATGVVDRIRPYAASGSAPFFWWLTRKGAHLVEGTSPAPGKAAPNPLFLRHTSAIAGLYVALGDIGPSIGLECLSWQRDETAWEEWSINFAGQKHLRPDAYVEVAMEVDGERGRAGAFIEVDFATMDQKRLRAKVARHRDYVSDRAWWNRHPGCPPLLLLTTSEARVTRFLANAEHDRPTPSHYAQEKSTSWDPVVAGCACVSSPEEALSAPVWRTSAADAPFTLATLLAGDVRTYRRLVATVRVQQAAREHHLQVLAINPLATDWVPLAEALADDEASAAVRFIFDEVLPFNPSVREEWAERHLDLVTATHKWWVDEDGCSGWPPPPAPVVTGWHRLYRKLWIEQANRLVDRAASSVNDPRLRRPAAALAAGELVEPWRLGREGSVDGDAASAEAALDHESRREAAVATTLRNLPLHRRLASSRVALSADYDVRHQVVCVDCGIARHDDPEYRRYGNRAQCPLCDGDLVPAHELTGLPPELEDSLTVVIERLGLVEGAKK